MRRLVRLLALLLSVAMALGCFPFSAFAEGRSSDLVGDVDGDGVILPRDAAIVARYLARWEDYTDYHGELTFPDPAPSSFSVGFGRVEITPDLNYYKSVPLAGFGNTNSRPASGVPDGDGLFVTCIAVRDERGESILLFTLDMIRLSGLNVSENARTMIADGIKDMASRATGISVDNMAVNASHTHSGPDINSGFSYSLVAWGYQTRYHMEVFQKAAKAARRAVADLTAATLWAGDTSVPDCNFVRRYLNWYSDSSSYMQYQAHSLLGETEQVYHRESYEGPNVVDDGNIGYELETPADNEVQYIVFKRDGVKDVLLYNWQCHADITGNDCVDLDLYGNYRAFGKAASDGEGTSTYTEANYKNSSYSIRAKNRVITADHISGTRRVLEAREGYLTAFFNGGSGNNNYYDSISYSGNQEFAKEEYKTYRLPGWDDRYYDYAATFTTGSGKKGYWRSQMIGAIVADSILKDMDLIYTAYDTPVHNDVVATKAASGRTYKDSNGVTQNAISHNWTDDWQGMRQLPTGNVNVIHSTYYTTWENNDLELSVIMNYLHDLALYDRVGVSSTGANIALKNSYSVTYNSRTETVTAAEIAAIRSLAAEYMTKTTVKEKKTFANEVLKTYGTMVTSAFSNGMYDNEGSGGAANAGYKKARLLARLATGLYMSNYSANALVNGNRGKYTDLEQMTTDKTMYTLGVPLECISIGQSVAFAFTPYEMFDTACQMVKDGREILYDENGVAVTETRTATKPPRLTGSTYKNLNGASKTFPNLTYEAAQYEYTAEKSPFALTFACGYSNGYYGYVPTRYARGHLESENFENGYETFITWFVTGTAEDHAGELIDMLKILYNGGNTTPRVVGNLPAAS